MKTHFDGVGWVAENVSRVSLEEAVFQVQNLWHRLCYMVNPLELLLAGNELLAIENIC